jgi:hypothetical protein
MIIHQLVAKGKLTEAVQILMDAKQEDAVLLMGRLHRLKRDHMLGMLSNAEHHRELEQIVEKIATLLEPIKPEYKALETAYQLAAGRGFKNNWIEQQLVTMPNDDEVRITIAETIEDFIATISCK